MAAKGRVTSTANSAMQSSQASASGVSTPAKESNSVSNTPSASVNGAAGSENGDRNTNGSTEVPIKSDPLGVGSNTDANPTSQVSAGSIPESPSVAATPNATIPKEEELALNVAADDSEQGWEKAGRNREEKPSPEAIEGRKSKKSKKQKKDDKEAEKEKEKEKDKEEVKVPEIPLVPAPPPAVNFWEQRKEAQAAKTKSSPSISQTANSSGETSSSTPTSKGIESRRKGKASVEDEKASQTGKDTASKQGQKKGPDSLTKGKEDSTKRPARGSRSTEDKDRSSTSSLPPPVEDSLAWPTPETALEEEKRKLQEEDKVKKDEKDDNPSNKPRTKEKWVPVPYTPSVTFNTPLPVRGGRGRGGARVGREGGRTSHVPNGAAGEKLPGSATKPAESGEETEKRGVRSSSLPPNSSKRLSSEDEVSRDARKHAPNADKSKGGVNKNEPGSPTDTGRTLNSTQADKDNQISQKGQGVGEGQFPARSGFGDRRNDGSGSSDFKNGSKDQRAEGRAERGRGGYRGRGSHNTFANGHVFANGHNTIPSYQGRQNSTPYSPPPQGPFSHQYAQTSSRGRGSSRSQSIPNVAMYPRGGYTNGNQQMPALQTMYDYAPMQTMSAMPYGPFDGQSATVLSMWVMPSEEREESMKHNDGPTTLIRDNHGPPSHMGQMMMPGQEVGSPAFSPGGNDFMRYGNGATQAPLVNGNNNHYHEETPLSAAVPNFTPGLLPLNGNTVPSPDPLAPETTFTDEQIEDLNLVFAQSSRKTSDQKPARHPYHNSSSRTFSNGSIDGRSINEELSEERQGRPLVNGSNPQERRQLEGNFSHSNYSNAPTVMWVKDQRRQAAISESNTIEKYAIFRERATRLREASQPGETHTDMELLYKFWAHFLCRNFNPGMYYEFRKLALEDSHNNASTGMEQLILYYDETLNNKKKTINEVLAGHYVDVVKGDDSPIQQSAFAKLRTSLRNGALDLKSRKRIDNLLDAKLKELLEQ
ncbi:la domain-containing protein [Botrytis cinerea]